MVLKKKSLKKPLKNKQLRIKVITPILLNKFFVEPEQYRLTGVNHLNILTFICYQFSLIAYSFLRSNLFQKQYFQRES